MRSLFLGKHMRVVDIVSGVGLLLVVTALFNRFGITDFIARLVCKDGTTLYGSFVATLASLLGFAIAAISITVGLVSSPRFAALRSSSQYGNFWLAFIWAIQSLGAATLVSLIAIFVNAIPATRLWVLLVALAIITVATLSLLRSGIALIGVLNVARSPGPEPPPTTRVTEYHPVTP
jgi:hypothetical protein